MFSESFFKISLNTSGRLLFKRQDGKFFAYSKCDLVFNPSFPDRVRREKINLKSGLSSSKKIYVKKFTLFASMKAL